MGLVEKILKKSLVKNAKMPHDLLIPSPKKVRLLISYLFGKRNTLLNAISLLSINMIKKGTILNLFFLYFNVHVFVSMTLKVTNLER